MDFRPNRHILPRKESEPRPDDIPIALFIDDEDFYAQDWEKVFRIPNVRTMRPTIPSELNDNSRKEITQQIVNFFDTFPPGLCKRVQLVIIDQFFDNKPLNEKAETFLSTLYKANPALQVLETSGNPYKTVYPKSKAAIHLGLEQADIRDHVQKAPESFAIRCMTLFMYTEPAFHEAARFDDISSQPQRDQREIEFYREKTEKSWEKLENAEKADILFAQLGQTPEELELFWQQATLVQKGLFLHAAWTIIGHIRAGNGLEFYGYPLTRLQALLDTPYI